MPPVSSLPLEAVIHILRMPRTGTGPLGSGLQLERSKPLYVALLQVCYFFASADGLCVLGSNRDAARAMPG